MSGCRTIRDGVAVLLIVSVTACGWVDAGVDGNKPPVAEQTADYAVVEGGVVEVDAAQGVLADDQDPGGRPLTARLVAEPAHAAEFVLQADGAFRYRHDGGEANSDVFSYVANDGVDDSEPAEVRIAISPVNDPPIITGQRDLAIGGERAVTIDFDALDVSDPDNPYPEGFSLRLFPGEGYALDGQTIRVIDPFSGMLSAGVAVSDGETESAPFTLRIAVDPPPVPVVVNHAPVLREAIPEQTVKAEQPFTLRLADHFEDPDGDPLSFRFSGLPDGLVADTGGTLRGAVSAGADRETRYRITMVATDPDGETVSTAFELRVLAANGEPRLLTPIPDQYAQVGERYALRLAPYFADPDGDPLRFTVEGLPPGIGADESGSVEGTVSNEAKVGLYHVDVDANDGGGGTVRTRFAFHVNAINREPELVTPIPDQEIGVDSPVRVDLGGYFRDPDGDPLTFDADGLPAGLTLDPDKGIIEGRVGEEALAASPYAITVTVHERASSGASVNDQFLLSVRADNRPPILLAEIPDQTLGHDGSFILDAAAYFIDPDDDALHFDATGLPQGLKIDSNGVISGTVKPDKGDGGDADADKPGGLAPQYDVTVTATDPDGAAASDRFVLFVDVALTKAVHTAACWSVGNGGVVSGVLSDVTASGTAFRITDGPTKGTLTITDAQSGAFSYRPHPGAAMGTDRFGYEAEVNGAPVTQEGRIVIEPQVMFLGGKTAVGLVDGIAIPRDQLVGYRLGVHGALSDAGYRFDFRGEQQAGARLLADPDMEADAENHVMNIAPRIYEWLERNPADVVVFYPDPSPGEGPRISDVEAVLDEVRRWESDSPSRRDVTVLIGKVISAVDDPAVRQFNTDLDVLVRATPDGRVVLVDLPRRLSDDAGEPDPLYFSGTATPSLTGYREMAGAWFESIRTMIPSCR